MEPEINSDPQIVGEDARFAAEVHAALPRVSAPANFASRVMARCAQPVAGAVPHIAKPAAERGLRPAPATGRVGWLAAWHTAWLPAGALAAVLAAATLEAVHLWRVHEQHRATAAVAQFDEAMQVTDRALDHASARLDRTHFAVVAHILQQNGGK